MVKGETESSGNHVDVGNSSHRCGCQCRHRRRQLLFIGLGISIVYQFGWAAQHLYKLTAVVVTTTTGAVHNMNIEAADNNNIHHRASSSSHHALLMKQTSDTSSLPSHPFPNAELQALVSNHPSSSFTTTTNTNNSNHQTASATYSCRNGLIYVFDQIALPGDDDEEYPYSNNSNSTSSSYHSNTTNQQHRHYNQHRPPPIPKILHFTAKSRCMTHAFASNIQVWKDRLGQQYSIYIHDDEAVNKFIYQKVWNEFPELKEVMACVTAGAAKADIWRYLIIWEYGGIYSDIDCSPSRTFNSSSIDHDNDDAFFPLEALGIPSQYFFAASPRHPVMYLSAKHALQELSFRNDIGYNNAASTTGPGAFKTGFILFQQLAGISSNGYVTEGVYTGAYGRSVRIVGSKELPHEYISREGIRGNKKRDYDLMGMTHFHNTNDRFNERNSNRRVMGCLEVRYKLHVDSSAEWVNIV